MRVISAARLRDAAKALANASPPVGQWLLKTEASTWTNLAETRRVFPHADEVRTRRGSVVTVFNVGGGRFRLVTAIHYRGGRVYFRDLLTHADYDKGDWKDQN